MSVLDTPDDLVWSQLSVPCPLQFLQCILHKYLPSKLTMVVSVGPNL